MWTKEGFVSGHLKKKRTISFHERLLAGDRFDLWLVMFLLPSYHTVCLVVPDDLSTQNDRFAATAYQMAKQSRFLVYSERLGLHVLINVNEASK